MQKPDGKLKESISEVRIDILRKVEFIAIFFLNMEIYEAEPAEFATIKTAGMGLFPKPHIVINPEFWLKLTRKQRNFVMIHEVLHAFFEHHGRARENNYHHELWNVATDFVINAYIIEMMNDTGGVLAKPEDILYETQYSGWTADRVYHKLLKDDDNDASKAAKRYNADGTGSGPKPLDDVSNQSMTPEEANKMKQEIAAGINAAEMGGSSIGIGTGMGNIMRAIKDLLEPKIHWTSLLQEFIVKAARNTRTYNRLSRRTSGRVVFPSTTGDHVGLVFGVDTSGSMSQNDLKEAATELNAICEGFESWNVEFVTCDTYAELVDEYNSEDGDDFSSIKTEFRGGGGTLMGPMVEFANESDSEPAVCIIVTDGYIPEDELDGKVEDVPTIVIVTSEGNKDLKLKNCEIIYMNDH